MKSRFASFALLALAAGSWCGGDALAQLPSDAIDLGKVKIPETIKSSQFDPVALEPAAPALPTWTHEGVEYGAAKPDSKDKFLADPAAYVAAAAEARWIANYIPAMSKVWCPVTDEVNPGGLLQWEVDGIVWESCCAFCDESVVDDDFPAALERLKERARKSFELTQGKYVEGAKSAIEGAIRTDADASASSDEPPAASPEPAWLAGVDLKPTYNEGVSLVMENRCVECHRVGGLAPMPFNTLRDIKKWTKGFKDSLTSGSMPPWPAEPVVAYANSRRLTQKELDLLVAWADARFPEGPKGGAPTVSMDEWAIGTPDAVVQLPSREVGAEVAEELAVVSAEADVAAEKWVVAAQAVPGNEFSVVHMQGGPLGAWYPGNGIVRLPEGTAFRLPAGAEIPVEILYRKEKGFPVTDPGGKFGLVFADDGAAPKEFRLERFANPALEIPAGADAHEASAKHELSADVAIHSVRPVMGRRGKSVSIVATAPGAEPKELVRIPRWLPEYQYEYVLAQPFDAPKGTVLEMKAVYDNSKLNAKNPDATATVGAGAGGEFLEAWIGFVAK